MKFSIKDFFSKCDQIRSFPDLVTSAGEILYGKFHFLCSAIYSLLSFYMSFVCRSYAIRMSLVCARMSSVYHLYVLVICIIRMSLVFGFTTNLWFMVKPQTSDIRMTYDYIRVIYEWHTSTYNWHTDVIWMHTSDIRMKCEYIKITSVSLKKYSR